MDFSKLFLRTPAPTVTNSKLYGDGIIGRLKEVKDTVDEFDYEDLVIQTSSWVKTWRKARRIVALPLSLVSAGVSFLFKNKKNDTTPTTQSNFVERMLNVELEDDTGLVDILKKHSKETKDVDFELSFDDLQELLDDFDND